MTKRPTLLDHVEAVELEVEVALRSSDLSAGLVPPEVTRALFPHEITARTNFAGIEDEAAAAADLIAKRLADARASFLDLVQRDLEATSVVPGPDPVKLSLAYRLLAVSGLQGTQAIDGARDLIERTEADLRALLGDAAAAGFARALDEARAQGLDVAARVAKLGPEAEYRLDLAARRLAEGPHNDLLRALSEEAFNQPMTAATKDYLRAVVDAGRSLSAAPLDDYARTATSSANGLGRQAGADAAPARTERIYASEILDRNTCDPCSMIDGTEYSSMAEARADYPNGTYRDCEGGSRCRGTLVFVWDTESPAVGAPAREEPSAAA